MAIDETSGNARLTGPDGEVTFDFNPATIVISHSVITHPSAKKGSGPKKPAQGQGAGQNGAGPGDHAMTMAGDVNTVIAASGIPTIAVRQVTFCGNDVKKNCEQLLRWTALDDASDPGATQAQKLPSLTFLWGSQHHYAVTLNQLTVSYTRFTSEGNPVRAIVDMTLNLDDQYLKPTNPTSGGLPGRRSHLLTGAETLAGVSTQTYGSPGRWRQIAAANGIQDPLRVPPGTLLYLPSAEENGR